ncbi:hypothetical protein IWQ61_008252 [Dispira simplex]|nr:hypothetical protein IWQ61_008252 [Dispira simplex]
MTQAEHPNELATLTYPMRPSLFHHVTALPGRWPSTHYKAQLAEFKLLSKMPIFRPSESLDQVLQARHIPSTTAPPTNDTPAENETGIWALWKRYSARRSTSGSAPYSTQSSQGTLESSTATPSETNVTPTTASGCAARVGSVDIGDGRFIRTLRVDQPTAEKNQALPPLVMTHGFGTGLGIFYRNYAPLAQSTGRQIYGLDWLGMGLSARPSKLPWLRRVANVAAPPEELPEETTQLVRETEDYFVESLERWRKKMGINKMVLLGHSFGGYMSALYALRYPEHVDRLILVSPMGVVAPPKGFIPWLNQLFRGETAEFFEGAFSKSPSRAPWERGQPVMPFDVASPVPSADPVADSQKETRSTTESLEPTPSATTDKPPSPKPVIQSRSLLVKLALQTWKWQISPQWFVRNAGPVGSMLMNRFTSRYDFLEDAEKTALSDYLYHLAARPGSGEYSITILTYPFVIARLPLVHRLGDLSVPTAFIYGQNDWMDYQGAEQCAQVMKQPVHIGHIRDAGHNMIIENAEDFNAYVSELLR